MGEVIAAAIFVSSCLGLAALSGVCLAAFLAVFAAVTHYGWRLMDWFEERLP